MRNFHRWTMTVFAITLLYWVITGLVMATYDVTDNNHVWGVEGGGPSAPLHDRLKGAQALPDANVVLAGATAAQAAASKEISIGSVDLRMAGSAARLEFADASGDRGSMRAYYADSGKPMAEPVAEADSEKNMPSNQVFRTLLKKIHRGNIAGMPGQFIGLATGLALAVMTITGVLLYIRMWRARCASGKKAFFWDTPDSLWRRLHRWVSIVAAALVLNIAVTGVILAWGEIQLNFFLQYHIGSAPYPRPTRLPPVSAAKLPENIPELLSKTYQAAAAQQAGQPILVLQLVQRDGISKGLATLASNADGSEVQTLAFNAATGEAVSDWATSGVQQGNGYYTDWHQVLKRMHRGDIIGSFVGRYIDLATGLALLYLTVSAFFLYSELWQRRRKLGRTGWFWK